MIREIKILSREIAVWFILLVVISMVFFVPISREISISRLVFEMLSQDLVPEGVELIVTDPLRGFLAQVSISLALAFVVVFPLLLYRIIRYISPALSRKENFAAIKVIIPSCILFLCGALFAYLFVIPPTFSLLYTFATSLGALQFFLVQEFIYLTFGIMFVTGLLFLLPVFMVLVSKFGLVERNFWIVNWRYAFIFFLLLCAVITPDGTGITMLIMLAPLSLLYTAGSLLARRV